MSAPRTLVIAEVGVNHNGSLALAKELIHAAAAAGADVVKFQSFVTGQSISRDAPKAAYQLTHTAAAESQYDMVRALELSPADHQELVSACAEVGVEFLSTPFDAESLALLVALGIRRIKVPSGEITNMPLLRVMAATGLPVLLSTGMATLGDIEQCLDVMVAAGTDRASVTLLHCNTEYPTPMGDVNLRAMHGMQAALGLPVGYSDHTRGIEVPIAAVALGATVIEKHITLDRTMPGPDHMASVEPDELRAMVGAIRNIEAALGDGVKRPSPSESDNRAIARKSIVASRAIAAGERFTADNLGAKRPGTGLSPMRWDDVIGRTASRDFAPDEAIEI